MISKTAFRVASAALLCLLLASCAYTVIDPALGGGQQLSVPTTVNKSRWRGVEASATHALRAQIQQQYDVELSDAPTYKYLLRTKVSDIRRSSGVNNRQGGTTLGVGRITMDWALEQADGSVLQSGQISRDLEFLTTTDESAYSAIDEILQEMAEQIAMELGSGLAVAENER
ncbi:MAG: hypothetical protein H8E15_08795 [Planctomycetes bacterium]|nr:hypothetical protein [Planctomycetota bacterium]